MNTRPTFGTLFDGRRMTVVMTGCPSEPTVTATATGHAVPMAPTPLEGTLAGVFFASCWAGGETPSDAWLGELELPAGVNVVDLEVEIEGKTQPLTVRRRTMQ